MAIRVPPKCKPPPPINQSRRLAPTLIPQWNCLPERVPLTTNYIWRKLFYSLEIWIPFSLNPVVSASISFSNWPKSLSWFAAWVFYVLWYLRDNIMLARKLVLANWFYREFDHLALREPLVNEILSAVTMGRVCKDPGFLLSWFRFLLKRTGEEKRFPVTHWMPVTSIPAIHAFMCSMQ